MDVLNSRGCCAGCTFSWASYNMKAEDAVRFQGALYCNMDCARESVLADLDYKAHLEECGVDYD